MGAQFLRAATILAVLLPAVAGCSLGSPATGDTATATATWYEAEIAPILELRCVSCHGEERQKGKLRLDTPAAIRAGGDGGPILAVDDDPFSMHARITSPVDDLEHMPPEDRPQLSTDEVATLTAWLEAGASFTALPPAPDARTEDAPPQPSPAPPVPTAALAAFREAHVHAAVIDPERNFLTVDFGARASIEPNAALALLRPVASHVVDLSLRGMAAAGEVLERGGPWTRLQTLDLSGATVGATGLGSAAKHGHLTTIRLIGTTLDPAAAALLPDLRSLRTVHVWDTALPEAVLAALRAREGLHLNEGDVTPPPAVEVEPEFTFGRPTIETQIPAVNEVCPVTGKPVDARYRIVWSDATNGDRVIGFCCPNCPKSFWSEPGKYAVEEKAKATNADTAD